MSENLRDESTPHQRASSSCCEPAQQLQEEESGGSREDAATRSCAKPYDETQFARPDWSRRADLDAVECLRYLLSSVVAMEEQRKKMREHCRDEERVGPRFAARASNSRDQCVVAGESPGNQGQRPEADAELAQIGCGDSKSRFCFSVVDREGENLAASAVPEQRKNCEEDHSRLDVSLVGDCVKPVGNAASSSADGRVWQNIHDFENKYLLPDVASDYIHLKSSLSVADDGRLDVVTSEHNKKSLSSKFVLSPPSLDLSFPSPDFVSAKDCFQIDVPLKPVGRAGSVGLLSDSRRLTYLTTSGEDGLVCKESDANSHSTYASEKTVQEPFNSLALATAQEPIDPPHESRDTFDILSPVPPRLGDVMFDFHVISATNTVPEPVARDTAGVRALASDSKSDAAVVCGGASKQARPIAVKYKGLSSCRQEAGSRIRSGPVRTLEDAGKEDLVCDAPVSAVCEGNPAECSSHAAEVAERTNSGALLERGSKANESRDCGGSLSGRKGSSASKSAVASSPVTCNADTGKQIDEMSLTLATDFDVGEDSFLADTAADEVRARSDVSLIKSVDDALLSDIVSPARQKEGAKTALANAANTACESSIVCANLENETSGEVSKPRSSILTRRSSVFDSDSGADHARATKAVCEITDGHCLLAEPSFDDAFDSIERHSPLSEVPGTSSRLNLKADQSKDQKVPSPFRVFDDDDDDEEQLFRACDLTLKESESLLAKHASSARCPTQAVSSSFYAERFSSSENRNQRANFTKSNVCENNHVKSFNNLSPSKRGNFTKFNGESIWQSHLDEAYLASNRSALLTKRLASSKSHIFGKKASTPCHLEKFFAPANLGYNAGTTAGGSNARSRGNCDRRESEGGPVLSPPGRDAFREHEEKISSATAAPKVTFCVQDQARGRDSSSNSSQTPRRKSSDSSQTPHRKHIFGKSASSSVQLPAIDTNARCPLPGLQDKGKVKSRVFEHALFARKPTEQLLLAGAAVENPAGGRTLFSEADVSGRVFPQNNCSSPFPCRLRPNTNADSESPSAPTKKSFLFPDPEEDPRNATPNVEFGRRCPGNGFVASSNCRTTANAAASTAAFGRRKSCLDEEQSQCFKADGGLPARLTAARVHQAAASSAQLAKQGGNRKRGAKTKSGLAGGDKLAALSNVMPKIVVMNKSQVQDLSPELALKDLKRKVASHEANALSTMGMASQVVSHSQSTSRFSIPTVVSEPVLGCSQMSACANAPSHFNASFASQFNRESVDRPFETLTQRDSAFEALVRRDSAFETLAQRDSAFEALAQRDSAFEERAPPARYTGMLTQLHADLLSNPPRPISTLNISSNFQQEPSGCASNLFDRRQQGYGFHDSNFQFHLNLPATAKPQSSYCYSKTCDSIFDLAQPCPSQRNHNSATNTLFPSCSVSMSGHGDPAATAHSIFESKQHDLNSSQTDSLLDWLETRTSGSGPTRPNLPPESSVQKLHSWMRTSASLSFMEKPKDFFGSDDVAFGQDQSRNLDFHRKEPLVENLPFFSFNDNESLVSSRSSGNPQAHSRPAFTNPQQSTRSSRGDDDESPTSARSKWRKYADDDRRVPDRRLLRKQWVDEVVKQERESPGRWAHDRCPSSPSFGRSDATQRLFGDAPLGLDSDGGHSLGCDDGPGRMTLFDDAPWMTSREQELFFNRYA